MAQLSFYYATLRSVISFQLLHANIIYCHIGSNIELEMIITIVVYFIGKCSYLTFTSPEK